MREALLEANFLAVWAMLSLERKYSISFMVLNMTGRIDQLMWGFLELSPNKRRLQEKKAFTRKSRTNLFNQLAT
jgi:hypothetical protein